VGTSGSLALAVPAALVGIATFDALSESTEAKFREEYTDSGVLINMHMYMRSLPNCDRPRTYFGWDKKHNKVLISTMCEHKKTSKYCK